MVSIVNLLKLLKDEGDEVYVADTRVEYIHKAWQRLIKDGSSHGKVSTTRQFIICKKHEIMKQGYLVRKGS